MIPTETRTLFNAHGFTYCPKCGKSTVMMYVAPGGGTVCYEYITTKGNCDKVINAK